MSLNSVAAGKMLDAQREPGQYGHTDPLSNPQSTNHLGETLPGNTGDAWAIEMSRRKDSSLGIFDQLKYNNCLSCRDTHLSWSDRWGKARSRKSKKSQGNFIISIQFIQYFLRACYVPSTVPDTVDRTLCLWKGAEATCLEANSESVSWSSGCVRSTVFRWRICLRRFLGACGSMGKASLFILAFTGAKKRQFSPSIWKRNKSR